MGVRRIALVVGDTRGHFYPALAVAEAYRRRAGDVEAVFFGPPGVGAELAARHGCRYEEVSSAPLARVGLGRRVAAAGRTLGGVVQARRALGTLRARLVMGFGSYASGPVLLAARTLGLRTVIHEANARPGLANRLLACVVDRVHLGDAAHAAAPRLAPPEGVRVTGWPVRPQVSALADLRREPPSGARPARVLVCSGSRGAAFMGRAIPALLDRVAATGLSLEVRHQSGDAGPAAIRDAYARAGVVACVSPFVDDMPAAYGWADVAIARAGAGTLAELAVAGLPSLLVPLADAAHDHQAANAAAFAAGGAALWTRERDWDGQVLAAQIGALLTDPARWARASAAARRLAAPAAADAVVDECERLMEPRG